MTLTRWKLMAGVLGLAMCGLAALAEPACRTVGYTARQQPTSPPLPAVDTGSKPLPPPVVVPPPKPPDVLPSPFPVGTEVPAPLPVPPLPSSGPPLPAPTNPFSDGPKPLPPTPAPAPIAAAPSLPPIGEPTVVPGGVDERAFTDLAKSQLKQVPLPSLDVKPEVPKPVLDLPVPPSSSATLPPPLPTFEPSLPKPEKGAFKLSDGSLVSKPVATPVVGDVPLPTPTVIPKTADKAETFPVAATLTADRKLKVLLCLGAGKPWFEVRDGEELVLKVVSDAVEVKAPADNGDAADVLKASGRVSFRTLGGNGTCDELRVVPGTGEVVVSGKVVVTSNWGKAETTATADKMTFRLGGDAKK